MKKKSQVSVKLPPIGAQYAGRAVQRQQQVMQNPVTRDAATQQITDMINQSGMPPEMFVEIGALAEAAIRDPKKYAAFVDYMVEKRLESREDLKKPDYQLMASMVVIGEVAKTLAAQSQGI
jgi:hypothetical protein